MTRTSLPKAFKIVDIITENSYTKTFVLDGSLAARAGQFVMAWLPGFEDKPFSLASDAPLSLTVAAVGPLSRALHEREIGDFIWVRGPLGRGFQLPAERGGTGHLLLIGGGYGVAPLFFLAKQAVASSYRVTMIVGARSQAQLLLVEAFKAIGAKVWITTEDGSAGLQGLATDALSRVLAQASLRPEMVYACGPTGMLQAVAGQCAAEDIAVQAAWEAHMRCGIGLCGSCEVGEGWLTCLDGPVFGFDPTKVSALADVLEF